MTLRRGSQQPSFCACQDRSRSLCNFATPAAPLLFSTLPHRAGACTHCRRRVQEERVNPTTSVPLVMGNTCKSIRGLQKRRVLSDHAGLTGAPSHSSKHVTPSASEGEHATASFAQAESIGCEKEDSGTCASVEEKIERSKVHWSQLTEVPDCDDDEVAEVSNVEVFKSLQMHPTCGSFFRTSGDGGIYDWGKLEVGEKFAEGGQGEIFHAHVTWNDPEDNLYDQKHGVMWVLKVFKKGTFLRDLQKQWPEGMFRHYEERVECHKLEKSILNRYYCDIQCGTLLPDGRFAFLVVRESEDLRALIDGQVKARSSHDCGPFSKDMVAFFIYDIAKAMDVLHSRNIVHRDLKASNVFVSWYEDNDGKGSQTYSCYVADFESSIGVVGTGFFRAPEILQALKDKVVNKNSNLFTKAVDVYSYGMTCYEILTGKLPFEGHALNDYDLVLKGERPEMPHYVDDWARELLSRCWQSDPKVRPTFREILEFLEANSIKPKLVPYKNMRFLI